MALNIVHPYKPPASDIGPLPNRMRWWDRRPKGSVKPGETIIFGGEFFGDRPMIVFRVDRRGDFDTVWCYEGVDLS